VSVTEKELLAQAEKWRERARTFAQKARMCQRDWLGGAIKLAPLADGGSMPHSNQTSVRSSAPQ
jgi:hypothetical protein